MKALLIHIKRSLVWRMTALLLCSTLVIWLLFSAFLVLQAERLTHDLLVRQHTQFADMLWQNLDADELHTGTTHPLGLNGSLEFAIYNTDTGDLIKASSQPALPMQPRHTLEASPLKFKRNEHAPHAVHTQTQHPAELQMGNQMPSVVMEHLSQESNINGQQWLVSTREDNEIQLVVASPVSITNALSHELAHHLGWLALLGLLVLIPTLYWALRRGIQPIHTFADDIATRAADNLAPINSPAPSELEPLKQRLNTLFAQVEHALAREQRFTADAAHELRTPLAATRLQLELAQTSQRPETRDKALSRATQGIDRATHVVSQLLQLARLEHDKSIVHEQFDLTARCREALHEADLPSDAVHLQEEGKPQWRGQPLLWDLILRNLIDNALHYGGEGTEVFIHVSPHALTFHDNGVGLSDSHIQHLGERFRRPAGQVASGAGLGWSIIQRIALLHHVQIETFQVVPHGFGVRFQQQSSACAK